MTPRPSSSRSTLFLAIGLCLSAPLAAQSTDETTTSLDAVRVTGSRIARPDVQAAVPVAAISAETISIENPANIQDLLRDLPQVGIGMSRTNSNFSTVSNGAASVDLRNVGPSRTLVLVNGRRFVSGFPGTSAVDLNNIPVDMVERVDVVTGGTSAVYGSDAIAGVVNFILKPDYEGVNVRAEYGITDRGDNERHAISLTGGTRWGADDRGSALLNYSRDREEGVLSRDRRFSAEDRYLSTTGPAGLSSFVPQGWFDLRTSNSSAQVFTFDHDNDVVMGYRPELGYNRNGDRRIMLPVDRDILSGAFSYELSDDTRVFLEPMYSRVSSRAKLEPYSFDYRFIYTDGGLGMPITNAYIPDAIRDIIDTRNGNADPADDIQAIQFRRRQNEVYDRSNDARRDTFRVATGIEGRLGEFWDYEASYVYGRMKDETHAQDINAIRYRAALDSIRDDAGNIICRDAAARAEGCAPINLFGFGTISQAGSDYVMVPRWVSIENTQHIASFSATGGLLSLPAGELRAAFGAEHRRERSDTDWDENTNAGNGTGGQQDDLSGEYDVSEAFAEFQVPLLSGLRHAQYLGLNAAARFSDYSTVGSTFSWNIGAEYAPNDSLRLRTNYAVANRAPNISELFSAITSGAGGATVIDPCQGTTATSSRPQDAACRAIPGFIDEMNANGGTFTYTSFDVNWMSVSEGGNPALSEEQAKTFTFGLVFTPESLKGFHAAVDYFDIQVDNAIGSLPAQIVVDNCVFGGNPANCDAAERYSNGKLSFIRTNLVNVAEMRTSGIDVNLGYSFQPGLVGDDQLSLSLMYTRLLAFEKRTHAGGELEDNLGQLGTVGRLGTGFEHKGVVRASYRTGGFNAAWSMSYLGSIQDTLGYQAPAGYDQPLLNSLNRVRPVALHDLQLGYGFASGLELYAGVKNVFDKDPPLIPTGFATAVTGVETAAEYDPLGRSFYAGLRYSF